MSYNFQDTINEIYLIFSDPTPQPSPLLPTKWEAVTEDSPRYYLDIDSELTSDQTPFQERVAFWNLFLKAYGEYEFGFYRENSASYMSPMFISVLSSIVTIVINLRQ